jgi:hypothetical protein
MNLKKIALTIGIAVLFALLIGFAIDAFYTGPEHSDYCKQDAYRYPEKIYPGDENCPKINYGDPIYEACTGEEGYVAYEIDENGCQVNPYCETCQVEYNNVNKVYSRNIFFITAIIGIVAILAGILFVKAEGIASGFMFGGILVIIYGTIRVFGDLSKIMRVVVLFIELVLLIWIGYRKVEKKK